MHFTKISSIYATTKKELSILKSKGYNTVKINWTLADYIICMKSNLPVGYLIPVCENSSGDLSPTLYQMTCKTVKINTISLKMHNQQLLHSHVLNWIITKIKKTLSKLINIPWKCKVKYWMARKWFSAISIYVLVHVCNNNTCLY